MSRCVIWDKFNDVSEGRIISISLLYTQDGRSMFARNVDKFLPDYSTLSTRVGQ
jgi:hypothetical protein